MTLNEQGFDSSNYCRAIDSEINWFNVCNHLYKQMEGYAGEHHDQDSVDDALSVILEDRDDFYLLLEREKVDVTLSKKVRTGLAKKHPRLQCVVSEKRGIASSDTGKAKAQDYCWDGVRIGVIDQRVRQIHQLIHEMTKQ